MKIPGMNNSVMNVICSYAVVCLLVTLVCVSALVASAQQMAPVPAADKTNIAPSRQATTIVLVRHAEKSGPEGDVPLSEAGQRRATALAWTLRSADVTRVFATDTIRARDTAAPLARERDLRMDVVPAKDLDGLVQTLKALPLGAIAVVVHHSNTIHAIIEKLGGGRIQPLEEADYDRLFMLTRGPDAAVAVTTLHYGASSGTRPGEPGR